MFPNKMFAASQQAVIAASPLNSSQFIKNISKIKSVAAYRMNKNIRNNILV
jgi:hypothetical protein